MPRPQTKTDLLFAATTQYDFSKDDKKKEAHWKRDQNLRDVMMHLYEWHRLMLNWVENNKMGDRKPFLMEGYNWKTYGTMNHFFWKECQSISLERAMDLFRESHNQIIESIQMMTNDELFQKNAFDWAMNKMKAHKKCIIQ